VRNERGIVTPSKSLRAAISETQIGVRASAFKRRLRAPTVWQYAGA
jgi:hypothetical protein